MNPEKKRLIEDRDRTKNWKRWGPYLSERQWGTVREDYSPNGTAWEHFAHDHARSRAYRWGEDGLMGITDRECRLCFSIALWNEKDPILKERLFGMTGNEGNHGEDVKEEYFYVDGTPTHTYLKALYKYTQAEYPYGELIRKNHEMGIQGDEYEIIDSGRFENNRYFDVQTEYAKADDNDILIKITITNHGYASAPLHLLPTLWFRNTWVWGCLHEGCGIKPDIKLEQPGRLLSSHESLGRFELLYGPASDGTVPTPLFTENSTNPIHLPKEAPHDQFYKDGINQYLIHGEDTINTKNFGTKVSPHYQLLIPGHESVEVRLRLRMQEPGEPDIPALLGDTFSETFDLRLKEADAFYASIIPNHLPEDDQNIMRQSYAGLVWTKQFYHYIIKDWLEGDPNWPPPPSGRARNADWKHLYNRDIISMPDKWEYPWYAAWDLAFHMIPFARIDPDFAKEQLILFLREWYMHPNGQIPAYEWAFNDVNPPVHAWACLEVFKMTGADDYTFLASAFQKLLLNFTWWVNRKDPTGNHLFTGGFLGLDNIGVFDRNDALPGGKILQQADGTAWMAFYSLCMLKIALELAQHDRVYSDMASKFFEHFVSIADAMNEFDGNGLWDEKDGFYYDHINDPATESTTLRVRSMVGLIPLFAVAVLDSKLIDQLPNFKKRMQWFMHHRKDMSRHIAYLNTCNPFDRSDYKSLYLLAIPSRERLERALKYMLDETEFLADHGLRSMSKYHKENPFTVNLDHKDHKVHYTPGNSDTWMFGGNSNWRGPIWFPLNWLLIESLIEYDYFYQDTLLVELPTGSGNKVRLRDVAVELSKRLTRLFQADENGRRPCHGRHCIFTEREDWKKLVLFYEYFHGDDGSGLGASHQTGWTALVSECYHLINDPANAQKNHLTPKQQKDARSRPKTPSHH